MSDYSKTDIGSGYNTQTAVNTELGKIETAVNSKVDKSGSTMTGDLDMNSNDILNTKNMDVQNLSISGTNVTAAGAAVSTLPDQSGNDGKLLSTNGSTAYWGTLLDVDYNLGVTGSSVRTSLSRLQDRVSVKDFGAIGDGVTDDTAAIQAALDYARTLQLVTVTTISDVDFGNKGGIEVFAPAGEYLITQIEVPETVSLVGAGKNSTLFTSTFNDAIIRNKVTSGDGTFDKVGVRLANFSVQGDRTQANQVGIDTLRLFDGLIENVTVFKSGGDGIKLRQALTTTLRNATCSNCVGDGIVIDEGINFWATPTLTNLPSNANTIDNCHSFFNDGAGLKIKGLANGNRITGGSYEQNYLAAGNNAGYNIHVTATTFSENVLQDVWVEGPAEAHVYVNAATSTSPIRITGLKHFGATTVDRAVVVDRGTVFIERAFGHGTSYPTIGGSNKPFQGNFGSGNVIMSVIDCEGSTIIDGRFLEDETNTVTSSGYQETLGRAIKGIDFDQTFPSTDPNILDAYQEGTWTPTLTTNGTDFDSVTYDALTEGTYVKIGKVVHIQGTLRTDAVTVGSATGTVVVGGLPFAAAGESSSFVISTSSAWTTNHPSAGYVLNTGTTINLVYRPTSNGASALTAIADVATGANANLIRFSGTYIANA